MNEVVPNAPARAPDFAQVWPSRAGLLQGARATLPISPGLITFAFVIGMAAAQKGLTLAQIIGMSALVFAGGAQLLAMQLWVERWDIATLGACVGVTAAVNLRMLLMGASIQPWIGALPNRLAYPSFQLFTDLNWAIATRYHAEGGRDSGVLFGAGLMSFALWVPFVIPGYLSAGLIVDPKRFGLDLTMLMVFAIMALPVLRRARQRAPFLIAAGVAAATSWAFEGYWFIVTGSAFGAAWAALAPPSRASSGAKP